MNLETIAVGAGAWIWSIYGKIITEKAVDTLKARWKEFNWEHAAEAYRQRVKERYGTMRVLGTPRDVSLGGIFTDVFVLDKPTAFRRFEIEQLRQDPSRLDARRKSALRVVSEEDNLFILGKPGAGKTTFLKHVALLAADGKIDKVPIFISLREWSDSGEQLIPFMVKQFEICAFPDAQLFIEHLLQAARAIVLFDGLDEVNEENNQRTRLIAALNNFINQYAIPIPKPRVANKCLITCRIAATEYSFEKLTYVEVADFNDGQIHAFVSKWFKDNSTKRDQFLTDLHKDEHWGLRELARIPLLLALLCLAFDETMTFPQRKSDLYKEALDVLLKKWDASRNIRRDEIYRTLSLERKRQMFARISADTFETGEVFFRQDELEKRIVNFLQKLPPTDAGEDIDGEAVLKAIEAQHGIFVERAYRIYSFAHATFQEYFKAKYVADNPSDQILHNLRSHVTEDRWREVFLLTASMLDDAAEFFDQFKSAIDELVRNDELIGKLLAEVQWVGVKTESVGEADRNPFRSRATALASGLARARAFDNAITRELSPSLSFDRACAHVLDHDLERARDLDRANILDRLENALDLVLDYERTILTRATPDLSNLRTTLTRVPVPTEKSTEKEWRTFANNLQEAIASSWDMRYVWKLEKRQVERLAKYIEGNVLFTDCLKLARVADRQVIQDGLLLLGG
jgi:hypothetical protein